MVKGGRLFPLTAIYTLSTEIIKTFKEWIVMELNGLYVVQSNNGYRIFLPTGILICECYFPPDGLYVRDCKALGYITRAFAIAWGVIKRKK